MDNPLMRERSLEAIAVDYATKHFHGRCELYDAIMEACFEARCEGISQCIQIVDGTINADMSKLSSAEREILDTVLTNLRMMFAHARDVTLHHYGQHSQ